MWVLDGVWISQLKFRIGFQEPFKLRYRHFFISYPKRVRYAHGVLGLVRRSVTFILRRTHNEFHGTTDYDHRLTFLCDIPGAFACWLPRQLLINRLEPICLLPIQLTRFFALLPGSQQPIYCAMNTRVWVITIQNQQLRS